MGRNPEQNAEQRAETRDRLLRAALTLFAEQGADRVTIAAVAREAGASKGLVYHYFDSKDALLDGVLAHHIDHIAALAASVPADLPPAARLRAFASAMAASVQADPSGYRLLLRTLAHPTGGERIRAQVRAHADAFQQRADQLAAVFAALGADDPSVEARFFQSTLLGLLVLLATSPTPPDADAVIARLMRALEAT